MDVIVSVTLGLEDAEAEGEDVWAIVLVTVRVAVGTTELVEVGATGVAVLVTVIDGVSVFTGETVDVRVIVLVNVGDTEAVALWTMDVLVCVGVLVLVF